MQNKKSYIITKECIACGVCKVVCPVHCISKGNPYTIQVEKCIRCGKCLTRCRKKVIKLQNCDK